MKILNIGNLTIPIPIIQGGMGIGVSLAGLASAVANMGGVGVISTVGIGLTDSKKSSNSPRNNIEVLRANIRKAKEQTKGVLGVNIMTVLTNFSDMVKTSIEEKIDIIFAGAGLPLDLPSYLSKGVQTKLVPIVSSARAAGIILNKWWQNYNYLPDAFVVEGPKAGGHLGFKPTQIEDSDYALEAIVPQVVEITRQAEALYNKKIPVIAAGGIYDGNDIYNILQKGASGVQMGTRFVATEECDASIDFKKAFVDAKESDIHIIKSPVGLPGRAVFNMFLREAEDGSRRPKVCKHNCIKHCNPKTALYCIADALLQAYKGNLNGGFAFTGSSIGKLHAITTVKSLFNDLQLEFKRAVDTHLK